MEFTNKEYKSLCDAYINDEQIIITGCNAFSQEFETTGKIAKIKAGELFAVAPDPEAFAIGVTPDTLIVEFGQNKEDSIRTPYNASFVTDLYEDDFYNFVIKEVKLKKNKQTLYKNKDYDAIEDWCRKTLIEYGKKLLRTKITPGTMHSTCQQLTNHIGKPINVYGETGVLFFVDSCFKGEILLYVLDFKDMKEIKIPATSKITEGKTLLKITENKKRESFEDYLFNQNKNNKL